VRVLGADGWKGRWVVISLMTGSFEHAYLANTMEEVRSIGVDASIIGVDMPIGLPEAGQRREADQLARDYVKERRQSVFSAPTKDLLLTQTVREANAVAKAKGHDGISAQTYGLKKHILEVLPIAESDPRLHEVHPEVSFVKANGDRPLAWAKTSWNGMNQRRGILERVGVELPDDLGDVGGCGIPDLLDAAIVAWSAFRIAQGVGEPLPAGHERIGAIWR